MAVSTVAIGTIGRGIQFGNLSGILCTVTAVATVYATATGGLPIDLAPILQQAAPAGWDAPNYIQAIHPSDVIGILSIGPSTNGYTAGGLVIGTPTYTTPPWMSAGNATSLPGILVTCPATFRLNNGSAQVGDGAVTDAVTFLLLVARNGANS
jgi:hypothetical protein